MQFTVSLLRFPYCVGHKVYLLEVARLLAAGDSEVPVLFKAFIANAIFSLFGMMRVSHHVNSPEVP